MSNTLRAFLALALAVIIGGAIYGAYLYPTQVQNLSFGSSAGATFSTTKIAAVVVNAVNAGANGTSTSILNTDDGNRYVTGLRYGCSGIGTSQTAYTGAGLASLQLTVGTTSTAAPTTIPASPFLIANALVVATSSVNNATASSTSASAPMGNATLWPTGTYMTFWLNATNTAVCTFGVDYLAS